MGSLKHPSAFSEPASTRRAARLSTRDDTLEARPGATVRLDCPPEVALAFLADLAAVSSPAGERPVVVELAKPGEAER